MATKTYCMLIDIKRDIFETITLKQIDTGNKLHIRFSEDGKPVNLSGHTVKFMAIKPDGKGVYNLANILNAEAGEVEIEITNQITAVEGELACEIELEGEELVTTLTFYINVEHKLNDGEFIESTHEFTALQKATSDAYEAIEEMGSKTDSKLEQVQSQVDTAVRDMNRITNSKLEHLQGEFETLDTTLTKKVDGKIQEHTNTINTKVNEVNGAVSNATQTVETLTQKVSTAIAGIDGKIDGKLDGKADKSHNHDSIYLGKTAKAESAKTADAVGWNNVTGKPSSFTPAEHNHTEYLSSNGGTVSGTLTTNHLQVNGIVTSSNANITMDKGITIKGGNGTSHDEIWARLQNNASLDKISLGTAGNGEGLRINHYNNTGKWQSFTDILGSDISINGNYIVASGTNSNGEYVRFYDGTQICRKSFTIGRVNITGAWGTSFSSGYINIGNWAVAFTNYSRISTQLTGTDNSAWLGMIKGDSATSCGSIELYRPVSQANAGDFWVHVIGVGRWK